METVPEAKRVTLKMLSCKLKMFTHLKLYLATAIHNFKWGQSTHIMDNLKQNICQSANVMLIPDTNCLV